MNAVQQRAPVLAMVGLGANLGDAVATLAQTLDALAALSGVQLVRSSSLYRSAPLDASGPDFVNAVASLSTTLSAPDLLAALQQLEQLAGRERPYRNAPRTLDLDLLCYGQARMWGPRLQIPHPRLFERAFVLLPLAEIAPERVSPAQLAAVQAQACSRMDANPA